LLNRRNVLSGAVALSVGAVALGQTSTAQVLHKASFGQPADNPAKDWTDAILYAIKKVNIAPPEAARYLAIGHMAGFAAMNGIVGRYSDSMGVGQGPTWGDPIVAFHVAAETALDLTMPGSFGGLKRNKLRRIPGSEAKSQAEKWGHHVGTLIGQARRHDGAEAIKNRPHYDTRVPAGNPMKWVKTSDDTNPIPILPGWGKVTPLGVRSIEAHRAPAFPDSRSLAFWNDVKLLQALGGETSGLRNHDQAHIAHFWEDGPHSVTPPGHFMKIAQHVLEPKMDPIDYARALCLVAMSVADAGLSAWDSKYAFDILRPETVLRGRMHSIPGYAGHKSLQADPNWTALIPNPRFPAYVSGHSTFGAAGARMTQLLNGGDQVRLALTSPEDRLLPAKHQGKTRYFNSIWDTAVENGLSRIYGGVHWTFDHDAGMDSGKGVADEIFRTHFLPRAY